MNPRARFPWGFLLALLLVAATGALAWASRWQQTGLLRTQLALQRPDPAELTRLKTENARLRAQQLPAAELESLRADHAALPRLRAEVESLNRAATANP